jgi:hypothetical protein
MDNSCINYDKALFSEALSEEAIFSYLNSYITFFINKDIS